MRRPLVAQPGCARRIFIPSGTQTSGYTLHMLARPVPPFLPPPPPTPSLSLSLSPSFSQSSRSDAAQKAGSTLSFIIIFNAHTQIHTRYKGRILAALPEIAWPCGRISESYLCDFDLLASGCNRKYAPWIAVHTRRLLFGDFQ